MDADPDQLADCAREFEAKLMALATHADPERLQRRFPLWACVATWSDPGVVRRVSDRLFALDIGALPPLGRLLDRHARLALLDRESLLRQLATLALARRPGVLRSCVAREARGDLRRVLGDAFDALMSISQLGRPRSERVAHWTPGHWAWVGYFDWTGLLQNDDAALRRTVRMSLPATLFSMKNLRLVAADFSQDDALALMADHGMEWSC